MPHRRKLLVTVTLIMLGYLAWALMSDFDAVLAASARVGLAGIAPIAALSIFNYLLRFARWHWYLGRLGARVEWKHSLACYMAGFALTTTPGKAGEAVRSIYLKQHDVPYSASLAALFVERIADVIAVALIAIFGIAVFGDMKWLAWSALGGVVAAVALLSHGAPERWARHWARHTNGRRARLALRGADMLQSSRRLLSPQAALLGCVLGVVAWGAEAWAFAYLLELLGYQIPVDLAAAIYALAILAGAASFLPGGIGGAEAAMALMLTSQGLTTPDAIAATLICRLCTLWLAVAIGAAFMLALSMPEPFGQGESVTSDKPEDR